MKKIILLLFFGIMQFMAQAQKPKATLNHIAIYVVNLQKSASFYQYYWSGYNSGAFS